MTVDVMIIVFSFIFVSLIYAGHNTCSKDSMVVSLVPCYIPVMSYHS